MDYDTFIKAAIAVTPKNGDEMVIDDWLSKLDPLAFVSINRHIVALRADKSFGMRVAFDTDKRTTSVLVKREIGGGE